jgi:uncharacterized protein (DUF427 family)
MEKRNVAKGSWGRKVVAQSNACVVVEGNQYFSPESVNKEFLQPREHSTVCSWKGTAHYYLLVVDGLRNENAAWYYPQPKEAAKEIQDRSAFWKVVVVQK